MEGDAGSGSAGPDEWGSAVANDDSTKLAELVLLWSGSRPDRALSILRDCVSLLEKEVALSAPGSSSLPPPPTTCTPGPTRTRCLSAIIVALNETCDGKSWYTSTKELQLASLEFCTTCRNYQTLHLIVETKTPRTLLTAVDASPRHPKQPGSTRVPRLRARRVTWNMPTAAELRNPMFSMTDVDCLEFGYIFDGSLDGVAWPQRLKTIEFNWGSRFNQPIDLVEWPACLEKVTLGANFNQPLDLVKWPACLEEITLGDDFNHPIECVEFPPSLQQLDLGLSFNQPIDEVVWPPSLHRLEIGEFFNQPIERAAFPASLEELVLGADFNQPIESVSWPDSLQKLVFAGCFNQPVDNVKWPATLQEVTFGLYRGTGENEMGSYSRFNQRIGSCVWPTSLRRLTLGDMFRQSLEGLGTWMPNLDTLRLLDHVSGGDSLLRGITWPEGLRHLTVFKESSLDGVAIPSTVEVYRPDMAR
ncbi:unnamed protein product [Ectocarpus fasciculatus]